MEADRQSSEPTPQAEPRGRLLLHCCCGPCAVTVVHHFRSLGWQVTGSFFNPNLHPAEEHLRRRAAFDQAARAINLPLMEESPIEAPRDFLLALGRRGGLRCRSCYELRLHRTARTAAAAGFQAFSTTLLISPYQDAAAIREVGAAAGREAGVAFIWADLRHRYGESCERARGLDLYRQNYCGCVFSRLERAERRARRSLRRRLC